MPLDIEQHDALLSYLRRESRILPTEQPVIRSLAGGVSSRTVLVERPGGEAWVLKQSLAKLRVAVDWFSDPQRIHCEALALRWLTELLPPGSVPAFVFEDHTEHILAMQAVPQPHHNWKQLMLAGGLKLDHAAQFGRILGEMHRSATERFPEVEAAFCNCTFFESLRIEPYYRYTATQVHEAAPFINSLIAESLSRQDTLVHGDFSPKNILVVADKLVLLDHEVAHIGDPAFDIGFSMTHLLSKAHHLPAQRADFAEAARLYWQTYCQTVAPVVWWPGFEARAVRHVLACLLARVAGRSPLEYLNTEERQHQREVVLRLMAAPLYSIPDLIERFTTALSE